MEIKMTTKQVKEYKRPVKKESLYALGYRAHDGKGNLVFGKNATSTGFYIIKPST